MYFSPDSKKAALASSPRFSFLNSSWVSTPKYGSISP